MIVNDLQKYNKLIKRVKCMIFVNRIDSYKKMFFLILFLNLKYKKKIVLNLFIYL